MNVIALTFIIVGAGFAFGWAAKAVVDGMWDGFDRPISLFIPIAGLVMVALGWGITTIAP